MSGLTARVRQHLVQMRDNIAKSEEAAGKIAQARREATDIVARRWGVLPKKNTQGANFDYAVQRELDESPIVKGLIATDQLARDRAQMYGLQATADLLEHLVGVVEDLEHRTRSNVDGLPRQRHAG